MLTDLTIMCVLGCTWMVADGRARGINPWPFVLITFVAGSFGPLTYLVLRDVRVGRQGLSAA